MATTSEFINYVCEQLSGIGDIHYKKMMGEYLVYVNSKCVLTVCNNTVYVKKLPCLDELMSEASVGSPYQGAKEHYILDIDDAEFSKKIVSEVEKVTPLPKKKGKA